jgi:hypothetical protein
MNEEIKSRINSGNVCYHSVQSLLSSRLLSRNVKVKIYKTIILPDVFYGCETWSLTLSEEHKLRVFENRVLRRIFGRKCALINSFHTNKLNGVCNDRQSIHCSSSHNTSLGQVLYIHTCAIPCSSNCANIWHSTHIQIRTEQYCWHQLLVGGHKTYGPAIPHYNLNIADNKLDFFRLALYPPGRVIVIWPN